jgi:hypothetical protein
LPAGEFDCAQGRGETESTRRVGASQSRRRILPTAARAFRKEAGVNLPKSYARPRALASERAKKPKVVSVAKLALECGSLLPLCTGGLFNPHG